MCFIGFYFPHTLQTLNVIPLDPFNLIIPLLLSPRGTCSTISVSPVHQLPDSGTISPVVATGQLAGWTASVKYRVHLVIPLPWIEDVQATFSLTSWCYEVL